ncbi:MAG: TRAP transporter substrate-binding protein [Candidatus Accumulibacter sp.]|jgi:TRAP-type C4-dicarboxylate transport system substrate-binding protein|nr:TRAP transporter substrate-binding protein [Accumulibacter sp.]
MKAIRLLAALAIASVAFASQAADPAKKTFLLRFAHHNPPTSYLAVKGFDPWVKAIEARTNGRIKFEVYPSQMLSKTTDVYDNTISGLTDIGWSFVSFYPGRFPLTEVINLPMLGFDKAAIGSKVIWDLYQNSPYLKKEFADVKVLTLHTHDGNPIISKRPILTGADIAGKKLRTGGGPINPFMQALGASPIMMGSTDTYQAAEKGVIDGAVLVWEAIQMQSLQEILKEVLDASVNSGVFFLVMNKKLWDSLPPDIQQVIDEESGDKASQLFAKAFDDTKDLCVADFVKAKGTVHLLDPAEAAKWQEKARPIWDKWVADLEAKGQPAKAVLEYTLKKVEEVKKQM